MQKQTALKIIEPQGYYEKIVELDSQGDTSSHSLHYMVDYKNMLNPQIANYFIKTYTKVGDVVLDPFCKMGVVPLECMLNRRIAFASSARKLDAFITKAKLNPVSLTQIALNLQRVDTKRLVKLGDYENYFAPFFDIDTYKEILSLKECFQKNRENPVSNYIEALLCSILHGPSASFCSAPTYQEVSIMPHEQDAINIQKRIHPEYRPVISRIIKKASMCERDLFPSFINDFIHENRVYVSDARNLKYVSSSSCDLILTETPMFFDKEDKNSQWLKNWFYNISNDFSQDDYFYDFDSWCDFLNETLMEFLRVLKSGKRVVLILNENRDVKLKEPVQKIVADLVNKFFSKYFYVEKCLIENDTKFFINKITNEKRYKKVNQKKYLVLRKK